MFILGLTGSIGMGKSATAALFRDLGIAVYDADAAVHALYRGKAAPLIEAAFPGTVAAGVVDRQRLGQRVLGDAAAMAKLERIVHPLAREARDVFLEAAAKRGDRLVVVDVPLLFETGGEHDVDAILVVTAIESVQKPRVLARPGMTTERFDAITGRQMPDNEKRRRAHFVIHTDRGFPAAVRQVESVVRALAGVEGHVFAEANRADDA